MIHVKVTWDASRAMPEIRATLRSGSGGQKGHANVRLLRHPRKAERPDYAGRASSSAHRSSRDAYFPLSLRPLLRNSR